MRFSALFLLVCLFAAACPPAEGQNFLYTTKYKSNPSSGSKTHILRLDPSTGVIDTVTYLRGWLVSGYNGVYGINEDASKFFLYDFPSRISDSTHALYTITKDTHYVDSIVFPIETFGIYNCADEKSYFIASPDTFRAGSYRPYRLLRYDEINKKVDTLTPEYYLDRFNIYQNFDIKTNTLYALEQDSLVTVNISPFSVTSVPYTPDTSISFVHDYSCTRNKTYCISTDYKTRAVLYELDLQTAKLVPLDTIGPSPIPWGTFKVKGSLLYYSKRIKVSNVLHNFVYTYNLETRRLEDSVLTDWIVVELYIPYECGSKADFEYVPDCSTPYRVNFRFTGYSGDFLWDFGDGSVSGDSSRGMNPSYTYPSAGTYRVSLITEGCLYKDTFGMEITVPEAASPPLVEFAADTLRFCGSLRLRPSKAENGFLYRWSPGGKRAPYLDTDSSGMYRLRYGFGDCWAEDSVYVLKGPVHDTLQTSLCSGDSVDFVGLRFLPPTKKDTLLKHPDGCDTLKTLIADTLPRSFKKETQTICANDSILFKSTYYKPGQTYKDTLKNVLGCDSIIEYKVEARPKSGSEESIRICANDSIFFKGTYYKPGQTYKDTLKNALGCDSIIVYQVDSLPLSYSYFETVLCGVSPVVFGGDTLKSPGLYRDTSAGALNGCDSILTIKVLPAFDLPVDTVLSKVCALDTFTMDAARKQALHRREFSAAAPFGGCLSARVHIPKYVASPAFSDTVKLCQPYIYKGMDVTELDFLADTLPASGDGCPVLRQTFFHKNTSDTVYIDTLLCRGESPEIGGRILSDTGLHFFTDLERLPCGKHFSVKITEKPCMFKVWPNPAKDALKIETGGESGEKQLTLHDVTGKLVLEERFFSDTRTVDLQNLAKGVYLLKINTLKEEHRVFVVKE